MSAELFDNIIQTIEGMSHKTTNENGDMLPEVIVSTKLFNSEIRKVQLEARDIPLHAGIFGMPICLYACSYSDSLKITKIVEIVAG